MTGGIRVCVILREVHMLFIKEGGGGGRVLSRATPAGLDYIHNQ